MVHTLTEGLPGLVLVDEELVDGVEVVAHPLQVVLPLLDGLLHLSLPRPEGLLVLVAELDQLKFSIGKPIKPLLPYNKLFIDTGPGPRLQ